MIKPIQGDYPLYFDTYISKIAEGKNVVEALKEQQSEFVSRFESLDESQMLFSYDDGKWNFKQIIIHISDTERVFCYRAHAISRLETQALLSFDHNTYMESIDVNGRSKEDLLKEFKVVREATISLFDSFTDEQWERNGMLGDKKITTKALAYMIAGHEIHHREILDSRYLTAL